jgi:DNA-binding HxlR family transcriptional regulator
VTLFVVALPAQENCHPNSSKSSIVIFMEVIIYKKVTVVKDVFGGKICYTVLMNTTKRSLTTEQPGTSCTTHPMAQALRLLGDMWTLMLVHNLLSGPRRFGELLEALGNVSPKTVSQRLKMLEEIGFVQRQAFAEIPPRVEYRLTEKGLALVDIMEAIRQFAERYLAGNEAPSPESVSPTASPSCEY